MRCKYIAKVFLPFAAVVCCCDSTAGNWKTEKLETENWNRGAEVFNWAPLLFIIELPVWPDTRQTPWEGDQSGQSGLNAQNGQLVRPKPEMQAQLNWKMRLPLSSAALIF